MTGDTLNQLRLSSGITQAELSRELNITIGAVADSLGAKRLRPSTEERYLLAIGRINRRKAAERERIRTDAILADLSA